MQCSLQAPISQKIYICINNYLFVFLIKYFFSMQSQQTFEVYGEGKWFCCYFNDNLYIPFPLRDGLMEKVERLFREERKGPSLERSPVKAPVEDQMGRMNENRLLWLGLRGQKIREAGTGGTLRPRVVTKSKRPRVKLAPSNPTRPLTDSITWRSRLSSPCPWFLMDKMGKMVVMIIAVTTSLGCRDD